MDRLLLAGVSVRSLAQSAARGGYRTYCLDWFADTDTAACCMDCLVVGGSAGFDERRLRAAADRLAPRGTHSALIYGSGFDSRPDLLDELANGRQLIGNDPETLRRVNQPRTFLGLLDELAIPYPDTREDPPASGDWLRKQGFSEGGSGVGRHDPDAPPLPAHEHGYFQRFIDAPPRSLLFLANQRDIVTVGFNRLLTSSHDPLHPFRFAGAITDSRIAPEYANAIERFALRLTRALHLVGLNSLDFVIDSTGCRVIELNARPSATLDLHDRTTPNGLVDAHLKCCRGTLPPPRPAANAPDRGFRTVFAPQPLMMPNGFDWPRWTADRPRSGTEIGRDQPICTVRAEGASPDQVDRLLTQRQREMLAALMLY
ncbi:MAG: ATP-grasp domain-containing protein [Methylotetracoccus sp.]